MRRAGRLGIDRKTFASGAWGETASESYLIEVKGSVATAPPLAVFDPTLNDVGSTSPYLVKNTERIEGLRGIIAGQYHHQARPAVHHRPQRRIQHARLDSRKLRKPTTSLQPSAS